MVRISITPGAFEAMAATLPLGSVGLEPEPDARGEGALWIKNSSGPRGFGYAGRLRP